MGLELWLAKKCGRGHGSMLEGNILEPTTGEELVAEEVRED